MIDLSNVHIIYSLFKHTDYCYELVNINLINHEHYLSESEVHKIKSNIKNLYVINYKSQYFIPR